MSGHKPTGTVYLVGGGTGDIELLTLKGARVLAQADVIIYDRLVNPLFLYLTKQSAIFIYCGKLPHHHTLSQSVIEEKMAAYAIAGKTVVRLKGGDPSVFGRVAEEMLFLEQHQIDYEVIPGVTAASVASIYAGIPLTCRGLNEHVTLATGHRNSESDQSVDFATLAKGGTLAFYMGMENLAMITEQLGRNGLSYEMPIAVIAWGSYGRQQVVTGTLETIVAQVEKKQVSNPAMIIIGEVVTCRQGPSWFERLPDFGRKLVLVSQKKIEWQTVCDYTARGADVWVVQVGKVSELRFAEITTRILTEQTWTEIIYLDQEADTKDLLALEFRSLGLIEKELLIQK